MTNLLRRLRGAFGIGLTWAGLWVGFGILAGTVIGVSDGSMGWLTGFLGATFATASVALSRRGALRGPDTPKIPNSAGSTRGAQWS